MIVFSLLSLLLLTFYLREGDVGPIHAVRSGVVTITSPLRLAGSLAASPFNALGNIFSNLTASQETLSELKDQNAELTAEVARLTEAEQTAQRLESLLGLQSTYNLQSTAARIIGTSGDAWSKTVMIDKGSADGFEAGMAVCNAYGVIGQITEVGLNTSTVLLIYDETSGVSAMVQRSRAQGMLRGQADGSLRLEYVSADADVAVGDIVITSGIGGVFPKGLPLGTVSSVEKNDNDVYYTVIVRTQASTENNEEVLVITALGEDQIATDDDVAAANATDGVASGDDGDSSQSAPDGTDADGSGDDGTKADDASADDTADEE